MNRIALTIAAILIAACGGVDAPVAQESAGSVGRSEQVPGAPELVQSSDRFDGERIAELDRRVNAGDFPNVNGIVVLKHGELLLERYYDVDANDTHNPRSVGKTFASAMLGVALDEGHIESLDQTLADFYALDDYDNPSDVKASVTLEQLLTMTSGFDGNDDNMDSPGNEEGMYPQDDWVRWTLNLPMASDRAPGERWAYFTAGVVVLGDVLHQSLPGGLEDYADETLFEPLGIRNYRWQHTPQGVANTAGGIQLTPRGFAVFGQLYKNGGTYNGQRILSENWVRESLTPRVDVRTDGIDRYGYLWWHKHYEVDGERYAVAYASGNGGNKIFVFDELPLVIAVTASAYGQRYMHRQVDEILRDYLLPAVLIAR